MLEKDLLDDRSAVDQNGTLYISIPADVVKAWDLTKGETIFVSGSEGDDSFSVSPDFDTAVEHRSPDSTREVAADSRRKDQPDSDE